MDKNTEFIERFIDACGTSEPVKIQRLLKISYQAIKNYLHGRLPQAEVLITISDATSCSIDWLLTGRGKKFVDGSSRFDTPLGTRQIEAIARRVCVEVINEMNGSQETAQPKVVVLPSSEVMSEKVEDKVADLDRETTLTEGRT